ncbi:glycosyltransferase [Candidatus Woesearchaeota archaeon]|nr:glycosyltransferase [Candidatus Woesearchaeota archaeon]
MATLSLCMIVKDEEGFLENCLESAKDIVDEIIVVDTGSKDHSKEIALAFGAKVFDFSWKDDFSAARNLSLSKAASNWILVLDADEMLDAAGREEILRLINTPEHCLTDVIGFKTDQRSYRPNKGASPEATTDPARIKEQYEGYESSRLVRLFRNTSKIRFTNKVHELVEPSIRESNGTIIDTGIILHHFSTLKGGRVQNVKLGKYASLIWEQLQKEPENPRYNHQAAQAFIDAGRNDLGMKYLMRTLRFNPQYPGALSDIAKLYLEMGNIQKSIRFFNFAIAQNKKDTASMNNLAVIYMNLKKFDIAKALLEKALSMEPENRSLLNNHRELKKKLLD